MVWLNHTHSFPHFKFTSKIFQIYALSFGKISSELCKFRAICPTDSANNAKFTPFFNHPIYFVSRCLTDGRELSEIPVNQAKFAPFTHKSRELCEIRTKIDPHLVHYQISDHCQRTQENWSESNRFHAVRPQLPRIT